MLVLGIESTCDETGCAIVKDGVTILSNIVSSQIDLHAQYGGVIPELACRRHIDVMIPVLDKALKKANVSLSEIDLVAAASCPGLIGALLLGLNTGKALALSLGKPFVGVNHVKAHLYATLMSLPTPPSFPCLGVILSGGHTALVLMKDVGDYELIGETVDDALGEAFDKVARILGLPYPGGPPVEAIALQGNPTRFPFKAGKIKDKPFNFSFSGIKTGVLYAAKGQNGENADPITPTDMQDIAASFQHAAFSDVINKTLKAANEHRCQQIVFGGGVTNSKTLKKMFGEASNGVSCLWPPPELTLDNAAMIAGLGYHQFKTSGQGSLAVEANPSMVW